MNPVLNTANTDHPDKRWRFLQNNIVYHQLLSMSVPTAKVYHISSKFIIGYYQITSLLGMHGSLVYLTFGRFILKWCSERSILNFLTNFPTLYTGSQ